MNVIVICERYGIVRDAFIRLGHNAVSCDLVDTEAPGPHLKADARALNYSGYELAIAHPPCQYLTKAGAGKFWNEHRPEQQEALDFVLWLWNLPVEHICIENPAGYLSTAWRKPDQYIDPWWFGHKEKKHTGLWLKNLSPLMATLIYPDPVNWVTNMPGTKNRSLKRSKTFPGIAEAMAVQWGGLKRGAEIYTQNLVPEGKTQKRNLFNGG